MRPLKFATNGPRDRLAGRGVLRRSAKETVMALPVRQASARATRVGMGVEAPTAMRTSVHTLPCRRANNATLASGRCSAAVRRWRV